MIKKRKDSSYFDGASRVNDSPWEFLRFDLCVWLPKTRNQTARSQTCANDSLGSLPSRGKYIVTNTIQALTNPTLIHVLSLFSPLTRFTSMAVRCVSTRQNRRRRDPREETLRNLPGLKFTLEKKTKLTQITSFDLTAPLCPLP